MTVITKPFGRLTVFRGKWEQGVTVYRHNRFTWLGSEFISTIDGNTNSPAEIRDGELVVHDGWLVTADGTTASLHAQKAAEEAAVYGDSVVVTSEALCQLHAEISSLREALSNLGEANAVSYDCDKGYMVCGQKVFDVVEGAPTEIPRSVGLFRFDKTTKTLYVSDELTNSTKDWKMIS